MKFATSRWILLQPTMMKTSRERPKSAPYLRLKNSKRTQSIGELGTLLWKKIEKSLTMPKKLKGGILWDFSTSILSKNITKLKGDPLVIFFETKSHRAENTLREYPLAR